jgi:hypothetical protein
MEKLVQGSAGAVPVKIHTGLIKRWLFICVNIMSKSHANYISDSESQVATQIRIAGRLT